MGPLGDLYMANDTRTKQANACRSATRRAVDSGKLVKSATCEFCGRAVRTEAAHSDYSKPLEVKWLCVKCHRKWDKAVPKGGTKATSPVAIERVQWLSRIVGHDRVAPDQLVANPLNFRTHPMVQREALRDSIQEVGFIRSVTVNRRTGNLVDGHERVWQALTSEQSWIDVEYVDLSEDEERKALAYLDPIGELAETDAGKLDELLREVETGSEALSQMLSDLAEEAGVIPAEDSQSPEPTIPETDYRIVITCDSENHQAGLIRQFERDGLKCKAITI